jgi:hypothetical protein
LISCESFPVGLYLYLNSIPVTVVYKIGVYTWRFRLYEVCWHRESLALWGFQEGDSKCWCFCGFRRRVGRLLEGRTASSWVGHGSLPFKTWKKWTQNITKESNFCRGYWKCLSSSRLHHLCSPDFDTLTPGWNLPILPAQPVPHSVMRCPFLQTSSPATLRNSSDSQIPRCRQLTCISSRWPWPSKSPQCHLLPSVDPVPTGGPLYPLVFRTKWAWITGSGGSGLSRGTPLWKPSSNASWGHDLSAKRLEERTMEQYARILGSKDQSLWKMTEMFMSVRTSSPPPPWSAGSTSSLIPQKGGDTGLRFWGSVSAGGWSVGPNRFEIIDEAMEA